MMTSTPPAPASRASRTWYGSTRKSLRMAGTFRGARACVACLEVAHGAVETARLGQYGHRCSAGPRVSGYSRRDIFVAALSWPTAGERSLSSAMRSNCSNGLSAWEPAPWLPLPGAAPLPTGLCVLLEPLPAAAGHLLQEVAHELRLVTVVPGCRTQPWAPWFARACPTPSLPWLRSTAAARRRGRRVVSGAKPYAAPTVVAPELWSRWPATADHCWPTPPQRSSKRSAAFAAPGAPSASMAAAAISTPSCGDLVRPTTSSASEVPNNRQSR